MTVWIDDFAIGEGVVHALDDLDGGCEVGRQQMVDDLGGDHVER
jgi:hypothetical protein